MAERGGDRGDATGALQAAAGPADAGAPTSLAGLLAVMADWSAERDALAPAAGLHERSAWPELPELEEFRDLWARQRVEAQVRHALAPAPADAGPLNSRALVHRMLRLMHAASPDYLRHFTAHVDMLAALHALQAQAAPAAGDAPAVQARRRRPRAARAAVRSAADPG